MSYLSDHLATCDYCQKGLPTHKPTIFIKSASAYRRESKPKITIKGASSYYRQKKLSSLAGIITGTSYPPISIPARTKGASSRPGPIEREVKLKALGKIIRGA